MNWLTATEIADKLKVNPRTVRRYWDSHNEFLLYQREGSSPLVISEECIGVLTRIRDLYIKRKFRKEEVVKKLDSEGFPRYFAHEEDPPEKEPVHVTVRETGVSDSDLSEEMRSQFLIIQDLTKQMESLKVTCEHQNITIQHLLEKDRDRVREDRERDREYREGQQKTQEMLLQMMHDRFVPNDPNEEIPPEECSQSEKPSELTSSITTEPLLSRRSRSKEKGAWSKLWGWIHNRK